MATVEFRQVRKRYDNVEVIHGVSLKIKKGQFAVVVGPSGCGKSTLLRMVAGLEEISSGEIELNSQIVNDLPPKRRDIAMVFQNYALYPHMTVYQNMAYGLKMRGFSRQEIMNRVHAAAQTLQLDDVLNRKPKALSGGQRQRVAMGRAIVREPTLFLFDEPLSNLDAKLRVEMRLEIYRLQRQLGITSIYVTHDQIEAMTLADILIVMNQGCIEQVGNPLAIYKSPETQFVASFIGSPAMNFLMGEICDGGRSVLLPNQQSLALSYMHLASYEGKKVTVGIRPEHLKLASSISEDQFKVRVDVVEALGSDTIVYATIPDSDQRIIAKLPGNIRTYSGEFIVLAIAASDLHFFDIETGRRIHGI